MSGRSDGGAPDSWEGKILEMIYGHYREALDALPLEEMPTLAPRLLNAGVCFGFADPITNIITNTLCFKDGEPDLNAGAKKRKRKRKSGARREVLSKIFAGDASSPPEARTIAERSLVGLLGFLKLYFRHLPAWDALRYLCLARADLLVAVHLIELDRCCHRRKDQFRVRSHAVKTALKCAAFSARLPNVDAFFNGSSALVCHLSFITQNVHREGCRLSVQEICQMSELLKKPMNKSVFNPMDFAARPFHRCEMDASIKKMTNGLTDSLRGVLMDRIHNQYLKAVSRLPMKDLRMRHHRSLHKAGYCYGPFSPVSNIIVNTIWYDTTFPASEEFEVDMISTLRHVESRSLNGLIAFLRASIPGISDHDAMVYLLKNNLKIRKAIRMARQEGRDTTSMDGCGYKAAADASFHPKPEVYLEFIMQSLPNVQHAIRSMLQSSHTLSSGEALCLSKLLSPSSAECLQPTIELSEDALKTLSSHKEDFLTQQGFVRGRVEAALRNYEQTKGSYELCIICGVNNNVGKKSGIRDVKYQYSHVNFWARLKEGTSATLFFAEFRNDGDSENLESLCYPVSSALLTRVRCCYCEFHGIRIVHPAEGHWKGGSDFEKIACGEHHITYAQITGSGTLIDEKVGISGADYIYLDPSQDGTLIRGMNKIAWQMNLDWEGDY